MPEQFIDIKKLSKFIELAVAHYGKHAPGWFTDWLDEVYMRLSDGWQSITLDEIITIANPYRDGQWQAEPFAVNNAYKLFDRLGRDTSGIIGY